MFDLEDELLDNDGFEIVQATDVRLGLTNIGDVPPDDWAANTGSTKAPESESDAEEALGSPRSTSGRSPTV